MKKHIPNIITLCNLLSGVVAIMQAMAGRLDYAALWIGLGIVFDFFDGLVARLLHVASPIGKELDSLADVVTSGVAPGLILYMLLSQQQFGAWSYVALLLPAFAAYRLAKFNLDTRQTHSFLGLPVPSCAIVWAAIGTCYCNAAVASLCLLPGAAATVTSFLTQSTAGLAVLIVLELVCCWLMISEVPLFALKVKSLAWSNNRIRYIFIIGAAVLIALLGVLGFALAIVWYVALSLLWREPSETK